jgi:DNA-directed RNA polymerase subunit RPC12/RpoP
MPIRFRCPTCTGLMSIARRKANAVVACPKCGEQVIVPPTEPAVAAAVNRPVAAPPGRAEPVPLTKSVDRPLFERPDFDHLLQQAGVSPPPTPAKAAAPAEPPSPASPDGIVLSYPAAAMLAAACTGLVVTGFAAGYLLR